MSHGLKVSNCVYLILSGKMGQPGFPGINGIPVSKRLAVHETQNHLMTLNVDLVIIN